jgi:hypothetical protein
MKPTDREQFEQKTSLLLPVIVRTCLGNHRLTDAQVEWFQDHVDHRVRWYHANKPEWTRKLNSPTNLGRDWVYMWVTHWLSAYLLDPEDYQQRCPTEALV